MGSMVTRPLFTPEKFDLPGGAATIRAIRPDDAPRLQAFVGRLSPDSIYFRFMTSLRELSDEAAAQLVNVDYRQRMALLATLPDGDDEIVIGVARYGARPTAPDRAEVAIVVEDRYQRNGLGRFLMRRLAEYARQHGIRALTATLSANNVRVKEFIKHLSLPVKVVAAEHGELDVEVQLD